MKMFQNKASGRTLNCVTLSELTLSCEAFIGLTHACTVWLKEGLSPLLAVAIFYCRSFNLLKPTGYVMHQQV
jgi:hypothetical protein